MATQPDLLGIRVDALTAWLAEEVDVRPPLRFERIGGGRSNLTYEVRDADDTVLVVRRPPVGTTLATAHDVLREHRVMSALADTPVPVPRMFAACTDTEVTGAPFFVMEKIDGLGLPDLAAAEALTVPARRTVGEQLAGTLAAIHSVDIAEVGLDTLAKHDGYLQRQLRRWSRQWEASRSTPLPAFDLVAERLGGAAPDDAPTGLLHGDLHVRNILVRPTGEIAAVLDWEICTLGDVFADLAMSLVYWARPDDDAQPLGDMATCADGFIDRDRFVECYVASGGREPRNLDYYTAFNSWRLAAILQGIAARELSGSYGEADSAEIDRLTGAAEALVARAERLTARLG